MLLLPRLTNSLRDHFDADQAYLRRKSLLRTLKSRRSRDDSELARKLVRGWDQASSNVRQAYRQFLAAVLELINSEVSSEEFQDVVKAVYDLFSGPDMDYDVTKRIAEKKGDLQMLVGYNAPCPTLQKVASLAKRLGALQCIDDELLDRERMTDICHGTDEEFGADISFQAPSRFHIDMSLENGPNLTSDSLTDPFREEQYDHFVSQHHHSDRGNVNLRWLNEACDLIVKGGGSQLSGDELAMALCRVLLSNKAGDEIAGDLLDLVGDDAFETVQDILSHRKELVDAINHGLFILRSEKMPTSTQQRMPSYGTQVTVQTEYERQLDKLRRKEDKKHKRGSENGNTHELAGGSFSSLLLASEKKHALDDLIGTGKGLNSVLANALPKGTTRSHLDGYEEVKIPPTPTAPMGPDEKLIKISELDEFARTAFEGYESLNRIQSRIYQATYYTNENILVCAPTGAGKTNIAMIAVLHEIKQHIRDGILHKDEFKIVYVAPMKALAAEVTSTFSRRLSPLNLTVKELTGDMQLSKTELEETQMIVTTPEKWDVITRKYKQKKK